ncbi:fimbria/pilus periplasmic chaperone [Xanthomonas sp. LMG 12459]|uniref:fimbrial biogenesis chaperone n=1 Tax=Xanthomonas sp. LMG 12459 TaxID=1591131 RepID=UPI001263DB8E|nr:fimbria/pilus periplasmic chaperone [Xanthomonas sp. LMG 12459]KAB7775129.1 pili assembly chaperone [Xanthomonas sp. LMG 12459]
MGRARARLLPALLLALAGSAGAAGVRISPTLVQLAPGETSTDIWLSNTQDRHWQAQVTVYRWRQSDGMDDLESTDEVRASPQSIDIPAQGRQLLRLVRTGPASANEGAYRLVLEERIAPPDTGAPATQGAPLLLRYSTPVFLSPADPAAAPRLSAHLIAGARGPELVVHNRGSAHARLSDLSFVGADGRTQTLFPSLAGYILAGDYKRWPLPAAAAAPGGRFAARLDDQAPLQPLPAE